MENQILPENPQIVQEQSTALPSSPTVPSDNPKSKYLIIGGVLLLCTSLALGGYYFGKQSTPSNYTASPISQRAIEPENQIPANSPTVINTPTTSTSQVMGALTKNEFRHGSFSFSYPVGWTMLSRNKNTNFPLKERLSSDDQVIAVEKEGIYLIVTISEADQSESGGIFPNDMEYSEYIKDKDKVIIQDTTFYLIKTHPSIKDLEESHAGSLGWSSLIEYVPIKRTASGNSFQGYETLIKRNGTMYNFIVVGQTDGITPSSIQTELKSILETIKW